MRILTRAGHEIETIKITENVKTYYDVAQLVKNRPSIKPTLIDFPGEITFQFEIVLLDDEMEKVDLHDEIESDCDVLYLDMAQINSCRICGFDIYNYNYNKKLHCNKSDIIFPDNLHCLNFKSSDRANSEIGCIVKFPRNAREIKLEKAKLKLKEWPDELKRLYLTNINLSNGQFPTFWPDNLIELNIQSPYTESPLIYPTQWPPSIEYIRIIDDNLSIYKNPDNFPTSFPNSVTHITLHLHECYGIELFPPELKQLDLNGKFHLPSELPDSVSRVVMGRKFRGKMPKKWPTGLYQLIFPAEFNEQIPDKWPDKVKYIEINEKFNKPVPKKWPNKLIKLNIKGKFNQPIPEVWPDGLEIINLGREFDQSVPEKWPNKLKELKLSKKFDHPIPREWPDTIQKIEFGTMFNHKIPKKWGSNMHHIDMGFSFNKSIPQDWPSNVQNIFFSHEFNKSIPNAWPRHLRSLRLSKNVMKLPENFPTVHKITIKIPYKRIGQYSKNNINNWYTYLDRIKKDHPDSFSKIKITAI